MKLSDNGLRLICSFEGYHTKQEDGSCKAYRCPAGVWTCGWGCTEGVDAHTHWTETEAKERFRDELEKFEVAVLKHVKVPLNQNEFDSLCSFAYNLGEGALMRSSILSLLNKEKRIDAAKAFNQYVKARDPENNNKLRVLKGLVARRAREAALFLKPMEEPQEAHMPQAVEPEKSTARKVTEAVAATTGVATVVNQAAPAIPSLPTLPKAPDLSAVTQWQSNGETLIQFYHSPGFYIVVCGMLMVVALPWLKARFS